MKKGSWIVLLCLVGSIVVYLAQVRRRLPIPKTKQEKVNLLYWMLEETHRILLDAKVEYWAIAGTLLGAIRDGGMIPWDKDVDLAILDLEAFRALKPTFQRVGLTLSFRDKIWRIHKPEEKEIYIDVFEQSLERDKAGNLFYRHKEPWNRLRWPKDYHRHDETFPLTYHRFGPLWIKGPRRPTCYLDRVYGEWKVPKVTFHAYADKDPLLPKILTFKGRKVKEKMQPALPSSSASARPSVQSE